jgi:hypothetical protein
MTMFPQFQAHLVKFSTIQLQYVTVFPHLHTSVSMGSVENFSIFITVTVVTLSVSLSG